MSLSTLRSMVLLFSMSSMFITENGSIIVPSILALDNYKVNSGGPMDELSALCSCVTELDLTNNLLTCWSEVCMSYLPFVTVNELDLTNNLLTYWSEVCCTSKFFYSVF